MTESENPKKRNLLKIICTVCLVLLLIVAIAAVGFAIVHWNTSASENNLDALTARASDYLKIDDLKPIETEKRGDYLAVLFAEGDDKTAMCVFEPDKFFRNRWVAEGGTYGVPNGEMGNWNYGSPRFEAVLIFCGRDLPETAQKYTFNNGEITYICPIKNRTVLDIFVIPDEGDISGTPELVS